jgi:outer membrane protein
MIKFARFISKVQMKRVLLFLILLSAPFALQAQKYCYVDTQYILANMPEYSEAQNELNKTSEKWQREIELRYEAIENMNKAYRAERVLLTEDMKREREEEIAQSELEAKELQKKRFGLNGDLFKKREELIKPIQDKIFKAIKELAEGGNYMVIFDKSNQSSIIFASPKYDKSDRVLKKMGIKPGEAIDDDDDDDDRQGGGSNTVKPAGSTGTNRR